MIQMIRQNWNYLNDLIYIFWEWMNWLEWIEMIEMIRIHSFIGINF